MFLHILTEDDPRRRIAVSARDGRVDVSVEAIFPLRHVAIDRQSERHVTLRRGSAKDTDISLEKIDAPQTRATFQRRRKRNSRVRVTVDIAASASKIITKKIFFKTRRSDIFSVRRRSATSPKRPSATAQPG